MSGIPLLARYTKEQLKELIIKYDNEKLTNTEIANKLGCTYSTVVRWRHNFGLIKAHVMPVSDEQLKKDYLEKFHNARDLAKHYNVSQDSVVSHLHKAGLKKIIPSRVEDNSHNVLLHRYSKDELLSKISELLDKGLTYKQIAGKLSSSERTISRWVRKYNLREKYVIEFDEKQLLHEYLDDHHSANFIANKFNVSADTVVRRLKKHGVDVDKTYGMKMARHRMHDQLWPEIKKQLDDGALKRDIINKYRISQPSLNELLKRKHYVFSLAEKGLYEDLMDAYNVMTKSRHLFKTKTQWINATQVFLSLREFVIKYQIRPTKTMLADYMGVDFKWLSNATKNTFINDYFHTNIRVSYLVRFVCRLLEQLGVEYEINNRQIIKPLEIDIWVPKYNIGFEVDPTSAHATTFLHHLRRPISSGYHQNKSLKAFNKNIRLVHIYSWDNLDKATILNWLTFSSFNYTDKTVDLNHILITKDELHKLGYYAIGVSQPHKNYAEMYSPFSKADSGKQNHSSAVVYDAGTMYLTKKA